MLTGRSDVPGPVLARRAVMIRRSTRTLIEQIVAGHVGMGNAFTAFDVTRELRSQGVQVVHEAAKRVVHGLYFAGAMPGYTRDLRPMGGPVPAFVYFPQTGSADADAYDLNGLRALMSAADLRATSSLRAY